MNSCVTSLGESLVIKNGCLVKFDNSKNKNTIIKLPESIKSIGDNAFENCSGVEEISLPDTVKEIGNFAFKGCSDLKIVAIPEGILRIGRGIFSNCSKIGSFTYSNKFISYSFMNGFEIQNNSVTFFDTSVNSEVNLYIPEGVFSIGELAFENCNKIIVITLPQSITTLENQAFENCTSLCIIDIPVTVTNFGRGVFSGCTSLMPIKISNRLTSYYFVNGLEIHDRCLTYFDNKINKGTRIAIPQGVTAIGQFAFKNCSNIVNISFQGNIKLIEQGAFEGTSITSMTIPEGVMSIARNTFSNCICLEQLNIPSSIKYIDKDAFNNCPKLNNNIQKGNFNIQDSNVETYFELLPL